MSQPADLRPPAVRYLPGQATVTLAVAGGTLGWLVVLGGLVGTIGVLSDLRWPAPVFPAILGGSLPSALWVTRRALALRQISINTPSTLLEQRRHGDLSAITDTVRRPLRPIG